MDVKVLTPQSIWQDFDPTAGKLNYNELSQEYINDINIIKSSFVAIDDQNSFAKIFVEQFFCELETNTAIIVIPDYEKAISNELVFNLARQNYLVLSADIFGKNDLTQYEGNISYGKIANAGIHIKKVCPSALDTNQYLYSKVIRRLISLAKQEFLIENIILLGVEDGVEIAMQVAGIDERVNGICCLNGGGYREYINYNKYENKNKLELDESMMAWLTGVASVAYAKLIKCPLLLLAGSNSTKIDIDRIINLFALLDCQGQLDISPRAKDYSDQNSFNTLIKFIKSIVCDNPLLNIPNLNIRVNEYGKVYLNANIDVSEAVKNVKFYYSYNEINHLYRNWGREKAIYLSENEYIANVGITEKNCPYFAFVRVEYEDGTSLSSVMEYLDTTGLDIKCEKDLNVRIIYNTSKKYGNFAEDSKQEFLYKNGISLKENNLGLKGINSNIGILTTYAIGQITKHFTYSTLQIDIKSSEIKDVTLCLIVLHEQEIEYKVSFKSIPYDDFFKGYKFEAKDFKDSKMMPLSDFTNIKALKILGMDIIISNILFI